MSFSGDLEHLPIVDVIQLLHSTRKTGTLCLKGHKGESQLVFNDGYFVSANHVNNSVRIGKILVDMKAITQDELEQALLEQKNAGPNRKPLIATLIEGNKINKDDAYKGLETLIELTIVEILTWISGTFSLDVDKIDVSDEYRYFPETLKQELVMNTQSVLMDALRIYDEKKRDGTLMDETFSSEDSSTEGMPGAGQGGSEITADLLGLDNLDTLAKRVPDVFTGIKDHAPVDIHRQQLGEVLGDVPRDQQEKLFSFLKELSGTANAGKNHAQSGNLALAVIVFSRDDLIKHTIMTVCKHEGLFVFTTDEEMNLDHIINQALSKELLPLLVIDAPNNDEEGFAAEQILELQQQKRAKFPKLAILQLVSPRDYEFPLHALRAGVRAVVPRPGSKERKASFVDDTITFLTSFRSYLGTSFPASDPRILHDFRECILELDSLREPPQVAFAVLNFVSSLFERTITFVVGKSELIAEKGFGVTADKSAGPTPPLMYKIPLGQPSVFQDVIENGRLYYGQGSDALLQKHLLEEIGAPHSSKILLLPIKNFGRVIALVYGDFGPKSGSSVQVDLLDILSQHASLVLDNVFYRKKFVKPSQS